MQFDGGDRILLRSRFCQKPMTQGLRLLALVFTNRRSRAGRDVIEELTGVVDAAFVAKTVYVAMVQAGVPAGAGPRRPSC